MLRSLFPSHTHIQISSDDEAEALEQLRAVYLKHCDASSSSWPPPAPPSSAGSPSAGEVGEAVQRRGCRLAELLGTEKAYVEDLLQCVD